MKEELLEILKNFNGFYPDMLYNEVITLKKQSNFNQNEFIKFIVSYTLLQTGIKSPEEFADNWKKIDRIKPETAQKLNNSLNGISKHWISIMSPENRQYNENNDYIKIYLSVDNSSLHRFANILLFSCLEQGYSDFDFKINKDESLNRRDNVVVYCNEKNFGQYVNLIQEIIENNKDIIFNNSHLLGIPYDEHISCGIDFDNGNTSYTDKVCKSIFSLLKNGTPLEEIIRTVEYYKAKYKVVINGLVNMTSNGLKNKC